MVQTRAPSAPRSHFLTLPSRVQNSGILQRHTLHEYGAGLACRAVRYLTWIIFGTGFPLFGAFSDRVMHAMFKYRKASAAVPVTIKQTVAGIIFSLLPLRVFNG
jgi:hypothetical protein